MHRISRFFFSCIRAFTYISGGFTQLYAPEKPSCVVRAGAPEDSAGFFPCCRQDDCSSAASFYYHASVNALPAIQSPEVRTDKTSVK